MRIPSNVSQFFINNRQSKIIVKVDHSHPDKAHIEDMLTSVKLRLPNIELKMI